MSEKNKQKKRKNNKKVATIKAKGANINLNDLDLISFDNNDDTKQDYEIKSDYRDIINNYDISKNKSSNKLTIYEATLIIAKRTTQLAYNIEPLVDYTENDTIQEIVIKELKERKIPFMVKRKIGEKYEYWRLDDMILDEELFSIF